MKKIKIKLRPDEVAFLKKYKQEKGRTLRQTNRANILLLCGKNKSERDISEFLEVATDTIWRIKRKYAEGGLEKALKEESRPGQPKKYGTVHQTELTAIACSKAPEGRNRWTLELLTEKMRRDVGGCGKINKESVRLMLKKTGISPG